CAGGSIAKPVFMRYFRYGRQPSRPGPTGSRRLADPAPRRAPTTPRNAATAGFAGQRGRPSEVADRKTTTPAVWPTLGKSAAADRSAGAATGGTGGKQGSRKHERGAGRGGTNVWEQAPSRSSARASSARSSPA